MTWRWTTPDDHGDVAERRAAKKYERQLAAVIDRAAADEAADFDTFAAKAQQALTGGKANRAKKPSVG